MMIRANCSHLRQLKIFRGDDMNNIISVIEFTSTDIKMILGYKFHKKTYVIKTFISNKINLDINSLLDKSSCYDEINRMIDDVKKEFKDPNIFSNLVVLLPSIGYETSKSTTEVMTVDPSSLIIQNDYQNSVEKVTSSCKISGKVLVYNEPLSFKDSFNRSYNDLPIGLKSDKLIIKFENQFIDEFVYNHYMSILSELNLNVKLTLLSSVCASHFITSFSSISDYIQLEIDENHSLISQVLNKRVESSTNLDFGNGFAINQAMSQNISNKNELERVLLENGLDEKISYDAIDIDNNEVSLKNYMNAIKYGYDLYLNKLKPFIDNYHNASLPLVLYGKEANISSLDIYFQNFFQRQVFVFESKVIGARGPKFINCLGALNISSYSYISFVDKKENSTGFSDLRG